jgi:hypothetical protein
MAFQGIILKGIIDKKGMRSKRNIAYSGASYKENITLRKSKHIFFYSG